jgi:16S rRNA (uracil1498-N3)-methyltransferase
MSAHHFFVDEEAIVDGVVTIGGDEAHHARVLRVREGERITVADGTGRMLDAMVTDNVHDIVADVVAERQVTLPRPSITLFQALTKGDKLELVVEKATEVGVRTLVPFIAERTVMRWDERKLERSRERLQAIARASAKQSRSPFIPTVEPFSYGAVVRIEPTLVLHEEATERLRDALPAAAPPDVALVVGPEGGLSSGEVAGLVGAGGRAVTLGDRILRTETAGPVAAAVVGYAYGWFG